jgi:Family of unknown function (DUF5681)
MLPKMQSRSISTASPYEEASLMIRRKTQQTASEQAVTPSPLTGFPPPVQYQFKPGRSGNPGGRPKILTEEAAKWLKEKDENGVTNAAKAVRAQGELTFRTALPHSVTAFREIWARVEPSDKEVAETTSSALVAEILSALLRVPLAKDAQAIEL